MPTGTAAADPAAAPAPVVQPEPVAGPVPDAQPEPDAGPAPDAQPEPDAGPVPDAQPEPDAGPVPDAQPEPDAGPAPDAQPEPDAEPVPDAQPEPAAQPVPDAQPEPAAQPVPDAQPEPAAQPAPPAQPEPAAQPVPDAPVLGKKKKRGGIFLFLGLAVAAVALLAVGVMMLLGRSGSAGYVYVNDDSELMYLKNLNEKTEAVELTDEATASSAVQFSADGKYLYYVELTGYNSVGPLYRMEVSKIGKDRVKPEKIDSDVYSYRVYPMANGDLLYQKNKSGEDQIWIHSGDNSYKLADEVNSWGGFNADQTFGYYTEIADQEDYSVNLYRIELKEGSKGEVLIKEADTIYSSYEAETLIYGVQDEPDDGSYSYTQTIYSVKPGEKKQKLVDGVHDFAGLTSEGGNPSFYYTTCEEAEHTFYDFVSDSYASSDAGSVLEEPVYPDWSSDYEPWYGIYIADDGRYYYESYSGIPYYLDFDAYPNMDDVSVAYAMADDLYAEALDEYEALYEEWYAVYNRQNMRNALRSEPFNITTYTLHRYADGDSSEVVSGLTSGYVSGSAYDNIFFYQKSAAFDGTVADVSELDYYYDVYTMLQEKFAFDPTYYQNINGTESEFELDGDDYNYISDILCLSDKEVVLSVIEDDDTLLNAYTIEDNTLVYQDTITDDAYSIVDVSGGQLYYFTDMDDERSEGDLYCYENGESTRIMSEINSLLEVGSGKTQYVFTNSEYDNKTESYVAELSVVTGDGKTEEISDEAAMWSIWFLDEKQVMYIEGGDLYHWDGQESRRVASDVLYFWAATEEFYQIYELY